MQKNLKWELYERMSDNWFIDDPKNLLFWAFKNFKTLCSKITLDYGTATMQDYLYTALNFYM